VPAETHRALLSQFSKATQTGDLDGLKRLLHDEAILYSDGGGVKLAALNPVFGADKIARFFLGVAGKVEQDSVSVAAKTINGHPGLLVYVDGELDLTVGIDCYDNRIAVIYLVRNPEKLPIST
jgi:RNA polymerase sigma-70 factor (ECF subfamily)